MNFRYYITDLNDGCIYGTDSTEKAEEVAASQDHFVVDSQSGEWVTSDGRVPVKEM